jgi:uncharacterized OB-fold protein
MEMKERYVGSFYGYLAEGKLMGQKCQTCGTYRLFPVPVCSHCQGTDMLWTELSKEGKLLFFSVAYRVPPMYDVDHPCAVGCIQLKEGPVFWGMLEGIDINKPEEEFTRLPRDVYIDFKEVAGNIIPIGRLR